MITTGRAPEPTEQLDVNPRCDRCKCTAHLNGKCPNAWCGCKRNREATS